MWLEKSGIGSRSRNVKERGEDGYKSERGSEGDNKNSIYNSKCDAKKGIFKKLESHFSQTANKDKLRTLLIWIG